MYPGVESVQSERAGKGGSHFREAVVVSGPVTALPEAGAADVLYVVDISSFIFRAYHALPPLSSSRGEPTHAVRGVASMLMKLFEEREPHRLAIALDSRGGSKRKERYPEYKANRDAPPEDLEQQIGRVKELVAAWEIPMLEAPGWEADDVIATIVKKSRAQGWQVVIVSADKDLLQLAGEDVVMYDTMRERVFGIAETIEKFGVPPAQVRDLLSLTGDKSDNVPGVPSVGPKTAAKLLATYDTLDGIYEHIEELKGKAKTKLEEHRDDAYLSRELVSLQDELEIPLDAEALKFTGGDPENVRKLFAELEFTRLLARIDPAPAVEGRYDILEELAQLREIAKSIRVENHFSLYTVASSDDPLRADIVGVALSWLEGRAVYIPLAHRYIGCPDQIPRGDAFAILKPLLENSLIRKSASDLKRELHLWEREGITLRGGRIDPMLASYLLDPGRHSHGLVEVARAELNAELGDFGALLKPSRGVKRTIDEAEVPAVGETACQYADYAWRLGKLLGERMEHGDFRRLYFDLELPLSGVLAEMENVGICLNAELLAGLSAEAGERLKSLQKEAFDAAGQEFNLGSPRQLETILFDELGLPVIKRTKTSRSTDAQVLEELAAQHPLPALILEYRGLDKLRGTYLDALPGQRHDDGRIHTRYNQAVAATGRLSSSDPNLQNIPIRTDFGRKIRDAFVPRDGWQLLAADYSQIELRVLAHLSRDPELVDAYATRDDVHIRTARALFAEQLADDALKGEDGQLDLSHPKVRHFRGQAKTVNFAVIYGQTQFALARNLRISRTEAKGYIEAFFAQYAGVKDFMESIVEEAKGTGYVTTLLGRRRALNDIRSRNRNLRAAAERIARNTPIQGTAADIIKLAMIAVQARLRREALAAKMLLTVHDELVFEVPAEELDAVRTLVREEMEGALELSVPLEVDIGVGPHWGAAR